MARQKVAKHRQRRSLQAQVARFWTRDPGLSVFLWILIVSAFLLRPLAAMNKLPIGVLEVLVVVVALSGVLAMASSPKLRTTFLCVAFASIIGTFALRYWPSPWLRFAQLGLDLTWLAMVAVVVMKKVFEPGPVTWHRIQGAVVVYLLFGVMCSQCYMTAFLLDPGAFASNGAPLPPGTPLGTFTYFSFTTLTTVGYGDIAPVNPLVRALANFEGLSGQIYIATLISRLISIGHIKE